jgi:type II secretory ATPase GspE/PulE/Tfp pilus assembly ATPase PilB-like protein
MMNDPRNIRAELQREAARRPSRSLIALTDLIFKDAHARNASDIHIDPMRTHVSVRLRIDGQLRDTYALPLDCHNELIARLKILAGLRTDEHSTPQDGRCVLNEGLPEELAVRISIMPTHFGENAVLRLLVPSREEVDLLDLGMTPAQEQHVRGVLSRMQGLVLVSGATGSGKTTTLYTLMRILSQNTQSLVTIEDPVEYTLPNIPQVQVLPQTGLTFARGLRSLLRQDPDVIMIGEIRDEETAQLAFTAALTGHMVLSTVHASTVHAVAARLSDLGVRDSLVEAGLSLSVSQRLVRSNCTQCAIEVPFSRDERLILLRRFDEEEVTGTTHKIGIGCETCSGSGYVGRVGIFDMSTRSSTARLRAKHALLEKILSGTLRLTELVRTDYA